MSVTPVHMITGIDPEPMRTVARERFQVAIAGGLGPLAGRVFRIGHLGDMNEVHLMAAIAGAEMAMLDCGIQVTPGSGVAAAGATVIGVSLDSVGRLNEFSKDPAYCASKLTVASDADGHIAQAYALDVRTAVPGRKDTRGELIDHGFAERTTFIITPDGKIAATVGGLAPEENVEQALKTVQALHTATPATR